MREEELAGTLEDFQRIVGGYIEVATYVNETDVIYVNEEGLLHGETLFFEYEGAHQPFAGNGVIVGTDDEGDSTPPSISVEEVRSKVKFTNIFELKARFGK